MSVTVAIWVGFLLLIATVIALDLGVFHRKARVITLPEALGWTVLWVSLALVFNVGIYYLYELNPKGWDLDTEQLSGQQAALQFLTGFLVEKSLSIDNIFIIAMVFSSLRVPLDQQHRVLFWGILGAVVMRAMMIFAGLALLEKFDWFSYILGAVLIYSAARLLVVRHDGPDIRDGRCIRFVQRIIPITSKFHGNHFFVRMDGVWAATPLFLALLLIEMADAMFAIDSIPAIFAISRDPFIIYTSNVFALLGLRSLYFVLAGLMDRFRHLKHALVFMLAYIGVKMMLLHHYPIPSEVSLAIIAGILTVGILASTGAARDAVALVSPLTGHLEQLVVSSYRQARTAVFLVLGSSVLLVGFAIILLPGYAFIIGLVGLVLLALALVWAVRWLSRMRRLVGKASDRPLR